MVYLFPEENVGRRRFLRRYRIVAPIFELLHGLVELLVGDWRLRASLGSGRGSTFAASSFHLNASFWQQGPLIIVLIHVKVEVYLILLVFIIDYWSTFRLLLLFEATPPALPRWLFQLLLQRSNDPSSDEGMRRLLVGFSNVCFLLDELGWPRASLRSLFLLTLPEIKLPLDLVPGGAGRTCRRQTLSRASGSQLRRLWTSRADDERAI